MFTFLYVEPRNKVEKVQAAVPIIVGILGSAVMDIAVDSGFKFADKATAKAKSDNIAANLWKKYSKTLSDLKPTKKNLGKWALKLPDFVIAEIVDELGDLAEETFEKDGGKGNDGPVDIEDKYEYEGGFDIDVGDIDPFYNTKVKVSMDKTKTEPDALTFFVKYGGTVKVTPVPYKQYSNVSICVGGDCAFVKALNGGGLVEIYPDDLTSSGLHVGYRTKNKTDSGWLSSYTGTLGDVHMSDWKKYLENLGNGGKKEYSFDGVTVNKDHDTYVRLDDDDKELTEEQMKKVDWSKLPGKYRDTEFEFDFDFSNYPSVGDGDEFDWELVEGDVQTKIDNGTIYNDYDFNYSPTINNYYQLSEEQKKDLADSINIIINIDGGDITVPGGGSGDGGMVCTEDGKIIPCDKVEKIDGSLLAYVRNAYEYATGFVKTAVDGLKSLGTGAVELTKLYGVFFGWLPKEIVVLMSSGLAIMLGLRIFRK